MGDDSVELLRSCLEAIVRRAEHYRLRFPEITSHVLVEVIMRHDRGSLACRIPPPPSELPIELQFAMRGNAYSLAYTHAGGGHLELRDGTGEVVLTFRNSEGWAWVNAAFNRL